jgi:hypothetical protein
MLGARFWKVANRLQLCANSTDIDFAQFLLLTKPDYLSLRRSWSLPSDRSIRSLAEVFGLTEENLLLGEVDFKVISARLQGDQWALADKYIMQGSSRMRTSADIFDWIQKIKGLKAYYHALKRFQLSDSLINHHAAEVSFQLLTDLCEWLGQQGYSAGDLYNMGKRSLVLNSSTIIGYKLSRSRTALEAVSTFTEELSPLFDLNWKYSISKVEHEEIRVKLEPRIGLHDRMRSERPGNALVCSSRDGRFAVCGMYSGFNVESVSHSKCIHRDDVHCEMSIKFMPRSYPSVYESGVSPVLS